MNLELAGFIVLSVLSIVSAVMVVVQRRPVVSAFALAINLVCVAGFFLLLNAQIMALIQVIVYAGAILVLILFVIMLLNLADESEQGASRPIQRWLGVLLAAALAAIFSRVFLADRLGAPGPAAPEFGTVGALGQDLFTRFFYPFEAISLLLIVAMVGAVLLAKRRL